VGQKLKKNAQYIVHLGSYIFLFRGGKKRGGGNALNIFSIFYTHHRIPNKHMMTINFDTITNNYEVIYVIKTVMKYYLKKIDTRFHQRLPNMVQRLFADVIT
jgi:CRISPR/Cas system-associated endonuclease Cas3-HD